jgi:hypothetical protein
MQFPTAWVSSLWAMAQEVASTHVMCAVVTSESHPNSKGGCRVSMRHKKFMHQPAWKGGKALS